MNLPKVHEDAAASNGLISIGARSGWLRRVGMLVGFILLIAAVLLVWRQHDVVRQALQSVQQSPPGKLAGGVALLVGSVLANIVLTGLLFSLLMSRYGRVGGLEMQALIASATLMNYVPLRPGFFGRLAYHKACNNISIRDSVKTVLQAMVISAVVAGYLALGVMISSKTNGSPWFIALTPPIVLALGGAVFSTQRIWLWSMSIRFAEVLVIALRYSAAFALIGSPIDSRAALAFACISVIASMVPFFSNGLGLREWAIGLMAPLITSYHRELGMTADLMIRAAEIAIALPTGLIGMAVLARYRTRRTETA